MLLKLVIVLTCLSNIFCNKVSLGKRRVNKKVEPMIHMNDQEFLRYHNYETEKHQVRTKDGYILKMYRVPLGKHCEGVPKKPPVVVAHGLLSSSFDWLYYAPQSSIVCLLADQCYDVWLTNSRGNRESREHIQYTTEDNEYWKFSWHEMGKYDLPAYFKHIKKKTNQHKLFYIGHSQGCTQFFVFCSLYPKQCKNTIIEMHAMAPAIHLKNMVSPLFRWLSSQYVMLEESFGDLNWKEFLPKTKLLQQLGGRACLDDNPTMAILCSNPLFVLCGFDEKQLNATMLPVITTHLPGGASVYQIIHFGQLVHNDEFVKFDYGFLKNAWIYGSDSPPAYPIEKISIPLHLHYGDNDWLVSPGGVKKIHRMVNSSFLHRVPFREFNHMDFMLAKDVKTLVYDLVLDLINNATDPIITKKARKIVQKNKCE